MIIVTKPYVSEVLAQTLRKYEVPILKADDVHVSNEAELNRFSEQAFFHRFTSSHEPQPLLCNSEASLRLLGQNLQNRPAWQQAGIFKNKAAFRQLMKPDYPDLYFQSLHLNELDSIDPAKLPYPVIVKPSVGYSSIGVYRVENAGQWREAIRSTRQALTIGADMYSEDVVNANEVIIEQWIDGTEYAIDAYFDFDGQPVILNVFARKFMHESDTSDRIYYTSKHVIQEMLVPLTEFLSKIGKKLELRNFPLHAEVRKTSKGSVVPVEINPFRFAGCGTTELGIHAYGINSYESFFLQQKPDWQTITKSMDDAVYSFFCAEYELDSGHNILGFNHEGFKQHFQNILEYRVMPEEFNMFAVVFYRSETMLENHRLIKLNLDSYIIRGQAGQANSMSS
ncbi:ATP-grasp domain-containing protein [Paenibacillus sp. sptzw28]|uniref:ATP-grasp domain-containing protein n=1 Tax=Paenibacillus sp. sptzw28 TaxID=715179 RepID=UPI001C6E0B84|nr:ATP-grasp domain-containing protein [Paenibacillus sp. sptzw28]QYR22233.1 ATP-grasp domain-containing protein [Paenibacillus sp. sptzw28]